MTALRNLKTAQKLAVGFGLLLAALFAVGYVGISSAQRTEASLDGLYHRDLASVIDIRRAQAESIRMGRCARHALIEPDDKTIATELSHVDKSDALVRKLLDAIDARVTRPEDKARLAEARQTHAAYAGGMREMLARASDPVAARTALAATKPIVARLEALVTSIDDANSGQAEATFLASQREAHAALVAQLMVIGIAIFVGVGSSVVIGRAISQPLTRAASVLRCVAEGDFTKRVGLTSRDETGQMASAIDHAIERVCQTLGDVRNVAANVASVAQELSTASQGISSGAHAQAASLEETSASLEEITATAQRNTENAESAAALATNFRDGAVSGGEVAASAIVAMSDITTSSMKIGDIVATIDGFAFQTHLLALNAAVEAARAGDQGRGFAVIATEVRTLAQQSAGAAKEIKLLIADALGKVHSGGEYVTASARTLDTIVGSIRQVADIVGEIATASREQLAGVGQIGDAVNQVDRVTQANAIQTTTLATTAEHLAGQADELNRLVAMFKLGDEGTIPAASAPFPTASASSGGALVPFSRRPPALASRRAEPPRRERAVGSRR